MDRLLVMVKSSASLHLPPWLRLIHLVAPSSWKKRLKLEEQFDKDFKLLSSMPFGWEALKSRRSAISSRFEHASRELARVDQGDGRYADFSDEEKTAVKETLIGMRTDALYALSVFDSGTIKQSPFQGDEDYINEMMGRASGIREGQPAQEDQPQIAADPVQAEYIETMIGKREADNISVGIASDDATLRDLESRAKAGRELLSYDPPGKKIIDGLISVGGFADLGQGLIDSAVQVSGQNALKAIGGAQGQLASAKSEAEGMLNQQLQKSQRMMERLLMTLSRCLDAANNDFEKLADARLNAGWSSIEQAIHSLLSEPASAIELLHSTYHSLSEMERKLYLYSPQLVARIDKEGQLNSALLFEPPRVPDHRQGLEEGLRALLTWLVSHERVAEAQGWAQLSRVLMESLPELDYLDKGAQVSIFVWAIKPVGIISICKALQTSSRSELLKQLDASDLYNMVYPLSEHEQLSLGGVGIEMLPKGFRNEKYISADVSRLLSEKRSASLLKKNFLIQVRLNLWVYSRRYGCGDGD